jgi:Tfp pilus assembly protein PilO
MKRAIIKKRALLQIDAAGVIICIAASLGMYFAVLGPFIHQMPVLDGLVQQLSIQNEECSKLKASVLTLKNQLSRVKEELSQSENRLEEASQINQRIANITTFLTDEELQVDQIQIGAILTGVKCDLVPIVISGCGRYRQCVAFLAQLHRTFPDVILARFELRGNPASPDKTPTFRFELFWVVETKDGAQEHKSIGA